LGGALLLTLLLGAGTASAAGRRPSTSDLSPESAYTEGHRLYGRGDFVGAADAFGRAQTASKTPSLQVKSAYNAGNALFRAGRVEEAVEKYKQALRLDPSDLDAKFNLEIARKRQESGKKPDGSSKESDKKQGEPSPANAKPDETKAGQQRPGSLSKEDAERLLEAAAQEERSQRREQKDSPPSETVEEDW
jgi:Ca-activated chloride channel family protein